jgi:hypothetical protein
MQGPHSRGQRGAPTSHGVAQTEEEGDSRIRAAMAGQESPALPGSGSIRSRSTRPEAVRTTAAARSISEESPHMGCGQAPTRATRGQPHNFVDGAMRTSGISGGSMQGWKRTRCTSVHRPIMTAAQTGPTLRNNGLRPNRSNRPLPTRSPRPASGQSPQDRRRVLRTQRASFRHRPRTHRHRSQPG